MNQASAVANGIGNSGLYLIDGFVKKSLKSHASKYHEEHEAENILIFNSFAFFLPFVVSIRLFYESGMRIRSPAYWIGIYRNLDNYVRSYPDSIQFCKNPLLNFASQMQQNLLCR